MAIEICTRTRVLVCMYVRVYTYVRRDSYMYMYILCTYVGMYTCTQRFEKCTRIENC